MKIGAGWVFGGEDITTMGGVARVAFGFGTGTEGLPGIWNTPLQWGQETFLPAIFSSFPTAFLQCGQAIVSGLGFGAGGVAIALPGKLGTVKIKPHFGHFTFFPAAWSGAADFVLQVGQMMDMGTAKPRGDELESIPNKIIHE